MAAIGWRNGAGQSSDATGEFSEYVTGAAGAAPGRESKRWFTPRIAAGQGGSGRITAWACMTSGLPASQGKIAGLADFTQAAVQPVACGQGCKICAGGEIGRRTRFRS